MTGPIESLSDQNWPKISIVTPSFNQGEFIEETILSVLSQAGDFSLEYNIMDGGSTDDSIEIIQKYDRLLSRGEWPVQCAGITYRWTSAPDKGQADAVDKGFRAAEGEILGWLNSDDTFLPGALQEVTNHLLSNPYTIMVYGNAHYTNRSGDIIGDYPSEPFSFERLARKCFLCQPAVFLRAKAVKEVDGLNIHLKTCMDLDLWIRIGRRFPDRIAYIDNYLATSRMYEENKTRSLRGLVFQEVFATVEEHFGYVPDSWKHDYIFEIIGARTQKTFPFFPSPLKMTLAFVSGIPFLLRNGGIDSLFGVIRVAARRRRLRRAETDTPALRDSGETKS